MLTQAVEDYLKKIYKLQGKTAVSTTELAQALKVTSASVTNMLKRLAQMKMVEYESYRGVRLTAAGEKIALEIIRHHRLLETYLKEILGYSWDKMHEDAERLEHHISEEFEEKIDALLGYPTHDTHGNPIPTRDLEIAEPVTSPLAQAETGRVVVIHHLSDTDPEMLHHLEDIGLMPQTAVSVVKKAPFKGPLTVRIGKQEKVIGYELANHVFVTETDL